jgi:hypothetical protein
MHIPYICCSASAADVYWCTICACPAQLPEEAKEYLKEAEEAAKARKAAQQAALWDEKMRATQTQSAVGIRVT